MGDTIKKVLVEPNAFISYLLQLIGCVTIFFVKQPYKHAFRSGNFEGWYEVVVTSNNGRMANLVFET